MFTWVQGSSRKLAEQLAFLVVVVGGLSTPARAPESMAGMPLPEATEGFLDQATGPKLRVRSVADADLPDLVRDALEVAVRHAERGDIAQARLTYRDALLIGRRSPGSLERYAYLERRFRDAFRAESHFLPARDAFEREDFHDALSLLYRLPSGTDPDRVRRASANGWYNLAIVALRGGRCEDAERCMAEAKALDAPRGEIAIASRLAASCSRLGGDRHFLAAAEALQFRGMDE